LTKRSTTWRDGNDRDFGPPLITIQENEVTTPGRIRRMVAVPTMVAGVYGMNFANMPELKWAYGYPVALATMILIDVYLVYRFKKAKWM
jgi:magnesium transporter